MEKSIIILGLILMSTIITSCNTDDGSEGPKYSITEKIFLENQRYGDAPANVADVYLPKNRTSASKVILLIHGGGWIEGDKKDIGNIASFFADSGIVAFNINYSFADSTKAINYISLLSEIDKAITYIKDHAGAYVYSPNNICLFGISAGAHLSLLYAYRNNDRKLVDKVIAIAGPTDLSDETFLNIPTIPAIVNNIVGSHDIQKVNDASPIYYNSTVATYLYHGKMDELVPYQLSVNLYNKIKVSNPKNKLTLFDNVGHGFSEATFVQMILESVQIVKY